MTSSSPWKHRILYVLGIGTVFGVIFAGLFYSTQHIPDFYREALADPNVSLESAAEFQERAADLMERIEKSPDWTESFSEQQINSWLAYEFPELDRDLVPKEVSKPRVRFRKGYILTACRYEGEDFSGVLSVKIRPRVTETRELALELISVKAGLIPIPLKRVLEEVSVDNKLEGWSLKLVVIEDEEVLLISHELSNESAHELSTIEVEEQQITLSGQNRKEKQTRLTRIPNQSEASSELSN